MELEYIDDNRQYDNYKKDIVTKIAYLIGVKDSIIKTNRFEQNIISSLEENDNAKIIRALPWQLIVLELSLLHIVHFTLIELI